ncbi:MAG: DUF1292 domain-containing protein [Roseburia sp.]|nr:DUF1292 domain-containing protein [Roseburia sp.]
MEKNGEIVLTAEDGSKEAFFVWEKAEIAGREYLLVADTPPVEEEEAGEDAGEPEALILRMNEEKSGGEDVLYDVVEDEEELKIISKYFEELLDDTDIFI